MPFRNYRQERAQKSRVKEERKQAKLRKREQASLQRKPLREAETGLAPDGTAAPGSEKAGG